MKYFWKIIISGSVVLAALASVSCKSQGVDAIVVSRPSTAERSANYISNRAPLLPQHFIKLPPGAIQPGGWLGKYLELQRDGLTGRLGEISAWLEKEGNAWLMDGGQWGWEEVPYWLRGYGDIAYILSDKAMLGETQIWLEGVFSSVRENGYFGPVNIRGGKQDLWAQMIMLWCLQSYYEYSSDERVIDLMTNYFKWQLTVPDEEFLEDYWENSRGGDNLLSVYWLYNRTGDDFLLELAEKIHRNTADWAQETNLPNWHNVNIAQCFREPAQYYMLTGDSTMLRASYNSHNLIRRTFGQVPGGMFGADENARRGYIDPRQGVETCGMVEQMASDEIMLTMTGDPFWADHCEDVAFNSYPAAVMPDFRALRYITCPNHVISDTRNHSPGIQNSGPFLAMNPFSSRCCQHNHSFGWPYYAEHLVLATGDNGAAIALYSACEARIKVADGKEISIKEDTVYPFEETVRLSIGMDEAGITFPFYFRIPSWTSKASVKVNGKKINVKPEAGKYVAINREWKNGDRIELRFPMEISVREWQVNKHSVSVDYGPLTLSLRIEEEYREKNSTETAVWDAKWQKNANQEEWPTTEIYPAGDWNFALVTKDGMPEIEAIRKEWPQDNFPFSLENVPLEFKAKGRRIPAWTTDRYGLCSVLPDEDFKAEEEQSITLVPMGAARLRISAFPQYRE